MRARRIRSGESTAISAPASAASPLNIFGKVHLAPFRENGPQLAEERESADLKKSLFRSNGVSS